MCEVMLETLMTGKVPFGRADGLNRGSFKSQFFFTNRTLTHLLLCGIDVMVTSQISNLFLTVRVRYAAPFNRRIKKDTSAMEGNIATSLHRKFG